jgi:PleD family two-component response regulator
LSLAEKIRTRLESTALGEIGQKTASFGVTTFSDGDSIEKIIARADIGLYAAKQGGRNRVEKAPVVINTETGSRFRYGLA